MQTNHRSRHGAAARRQQQGVTLMELMIVIVIVGILAAVGYPAYVGYSDRARRAEGTALLMDIAAREERFFFDNNQYSGSLAALGYGGSSVNSADGAYTVTDSEVGSGPTGSVATSFQITAKPNFTDDTCGNLTLDSRGTQGISTSTTPADIQRCWGR